MKPISFVGLLFMIVGLLIMVYGGFRYTWKTHTAEVGSVELSVSEKKNVYIPIWIGFTFFVIGGGILLTKRKKK